MKNLNKIFLGVVALSALVGCEDKMREMNTNPNTIGNTSVQYMFTGATSSFGYGTRDALILKFSGVMQSMQYITRYGIDNPPYYNPLDQNGSAPGSWGIEYDQFFGNHGNKMQSILTYIDTQIAEADKSKYKDVYAITNVIMAYEQWGIFEHYGAAVYKNAFKAITSGITRPDYDLIQDTWQDIDARLKAAIEVLAAPADPLAIVLGSNDYFNGWKSEAVQVGGGATVSTVGQNKQRTNWLKFANMFRLEMAWKLAKRAPEHFETVKREVAAVENGIMTALDEGTYFHYEKYYDNNPDDVDVISQSYAVAEPFINTLKRLKDPRLPYLARPNGLNAETSINFAVMQQYFPDSLAKYPELMSGSNIFVGQTPNPRYQKTMIMAGTPNIFPSSQVKTFNKLKNPMGDQPFIYVDAEGEKHEITKLEEFDLSLQIVSPAQGRYFVKCGGKSDKNGSNAINNNVSSIRYDGAGGDWGDGSKLFLRRPVFTYTRQCFMFAYLGLTIGGKTPQQWYEEGTRAAMKELRDDALRYKIQIATNPNFPKFPTVNPDGLYTYSDAQIEDYVSKLPAMSPATIIEQAWISMYVEPETAYNWYLLTGYPELKTNNTPQEAANQPVAYLERPFTSSDVELIIQRRGCLPDRTTVNPNFPIIKALLEKQEGFGQWLETSGRIWWDVQ